MIARLIAWSARNLLLVLFGTGFAAAAGLYALLHLPLDAIPDLSDTQVIVYTEYPGQAPQVIEDQVTYPLTTAMLTVPKSKVVRGFSFFGVSFVYVIFEDGTDIYWARSRVLEFLNGASARLPAGVTPTIGPDATGVGWVYQYAVMSKELNLADTRTLQDWNLKFALAKAEGVAEVASVGGFVKQYNVILDPQRMRDRGITMQKMRDAIRASNADVGGRTVELSEFEYVIRGKGYIKSINDLGDIVLKTSGGTPVLLRDVARVELGPDERRGIAELNGEGEVASGIVLQRFGLNALEVIQNVKKRFREIASSLPKSVEIVPVYDRSNLIYAAIDTLKHTLFEESVVVALVCIVFLLHVRSALVAILMLPVGILMAFGAMKLLGLGSNIMSLGGIAIAIGAMVDAAIVMIENAHKHLERAEPGKSRIDVLIAAAAEVGPGAVLQPADHHGVVHADLHARIAGGAAVQPACVHQDVLDGGRRAPLGDVGAGADGDLRARADRSGAPESDQPVPDLDLPPGDQGRHAGEDAGGRARARRAGREHLAGAPARHRVHAEPQRRHAALHADHAAGHLRHQGRRTDADPGPNHSILSGSRLGLRQGRARCDRPPIRHRPRCSKPSSTSSRRKSGAPA
ncbi:CzcA family heavy metal efflux pump [Bradyrhizobium sp. LM3.2]